MTTAYISVGSNIEPAKHIRNGLKTVQAHYGKLQVSSVYESAAVGFDGDNFYNLVIAFETEENPHDIAKMLRDIEHQHGRKRTTGQKFNARTLDLDLILYGDAILKDEGLDVPRDEIFKYAFVLQPLAEIAPHVQHPETQQNYKDLWQQFDKTTQNLWIVDINVI